MIAARLIGCITDMIVSCRIREEKTAINEERPATTEAVVTGTNDGRGSGFDPAGGVFHVGHVTRHGAAGWSIRPPSSSLLPSPLSCPTITRQDAEAQETDHNTRCEDAQR